MIEVKKSRDRSDFCLSCGSEKSLVNINIRRNPRMNASTFCLCRDCAKEIYWRLIEMEGEEES
ncbi:MAG: hypothetical protein LUE14_05490 [Clostridiales bacterium]|nr:hypothetical protein [Clostridiales bacterium]